MDARGAGPGLRTGTPRPQHSDWYGRNPDGTLNSTRPEPCTPKDAQAVFKKWLGAGYDQDALCAVLAASAVEQLDGDPLWLLVISGSGNAKTETVQSLTGADAVLTSSIASEGALLSGTSKKERAEDATGGLLRQMGERGVLVIKDVTTILAMSGDARDKVLSGLREVYDGKWFRDIGVDGGRRLTWKGRMAVGRCGHLSLGYPPLGYRHEG
jgi:cellobiose-specific phosphotransferase system component IIA